MPASFLGELILRPIFEFILMFVCYHVGWVVVAVLSFGRLQCDRFLADTPRRKMKWGGTFHRRGQQIYLTAEATALVGLLFIALAVAAGFVIHYSLKA